MPYLACIVLMKVENVDMDSSHSSHQIMEEFGWRHLISVLTYVFHFTFLSITQRARAYILVHSNYSSYFILSQYFADYFFVLCVTPAIAINGSEGVFHNDNH